MRLEQFIKEQKKDATLFVNLPIADMKDLFRQALKGWERYEKLRALSPKQFDALVDKNIGTGIRFDKLVDQLWEDES